MCNFWRKVTAFFVPVQIFLHISFFLCTFAPQIMGTMNKNQFYNLLLAALLLMPSCVTQRKLTYFNDIDTARLKIVNPQQTVQADPVIKVGDAMFISVTAIDMEAVAPFNLPAIVSSTSRSATVATQPSLQCYTVAPDGSIDFPVLGKLTIAGMRKSELKSLLEQQISSHVNNPIIIINFVDAYVTVMGEVTAPQRVSMANGHLTILEALASAGDVTPYGKRDNVIVMREENDEMVYARLNLNSSDIVQSPYYYLHQNDVVYVSPNRVRATNSQNIGLWLSMVSTVASAATVIVTVIQLTK